MQSILTQPLNKTQSLFEPGLYTDKYSIVYAPTHTHTYSSCFTTHAHTQVVDVAKAVLSAMRDPASKGQTYELIG